MNVLVACEYSGTVRDAFIRAGHEAISCDLLPSESDLGEHYQGDVFDYLSLTEVKFDMMIAHPPCTYLAKAGLHFLNSQTGRKKLLDDSFSFVKALFDFPISRIAIENPVGWLNTHWKKPDQIIHPYFFGTPVIKETCLWLKGLPPLQYRLVDDLFGKRTAVDKPIGGKFVILKSGTRKGQKYYYRWRDGKNAKQRSKTFKCIADAMSDQWGVLDNAK